jgi:DNA processing protein
MNIKKLTLKSPSYPEVLLKLETKPPGQLFTTGADLNELLKRPAVTIIGSRQVTPYGERITRELASQLAAQGIVIVSGLAYGIDAIAHEAALEAGGLCIAVLPSPLDNVLPAANRYLAQQILETGGALVSEYSPGDIPHKQNFVARNRIMSGLADVVLITEAGKKSGALHTARYAIEQNKTILAVPGNIYFDSSTGTNNLIKSGGAGIVTGLTDVLNVLGLVAHKTHARQVRGRNRNEQIILDLMLAGVSEGDKLLDQSGLEVPQFNQALTMLEINSAIRPLGGNEWAIY